MPSPRRRDVRSTVIQTYAETYTDADVTGIAFHNVARAAAELAHAAQTASRACVRTSFAIPGRRDNTLGGTQPKIRYFLTHTYAETYTDADVTFSHTHMRETRRGRGRARQDLAGFELGYLASVDDVCCNPRV